MENGLLHSNIGRNQSQKARVEIEQNFTWCKQKVTGISAAEIRPVSQKIQYGKSETKRAITNVLDYVLKNIYIQFVAVVKCCIEIL